MTEWMTRSQFEATAPRMPQSEIQRIVFQIVDDELENDVKWPADIDESEPYLLQPVKRWFGVLDSNYIVIELHVVPTSRPGPTYYASVMTPYSQECSHRFAWERHRDLVNLPASIMDQPVTWIDSKNQPPECVVYRADPRGFESPVYEALSRREGMLLADYLRRLYRNVEYSLGAPESDCDWKVCRLRNDGTEIQVGNYPARPMALEYALSLSSRDSSTFFVRPQQTEFEKRAYKLIDGFASLVEEEDPKGGNESIE